MAPKKQTFYVTTPVYYATAKPHLGSLYSTLMADVLVRWQKLHGKDVFFLTGTDEHGQKIAEAAQQAGKSPKKFLDDLIPSFKKAWQVYGINYNHLIRTTDDYHISAAQEFIKTLIKKGDIYKAAYKGWYCTPCETFVTEKEDKKQQYTEDQGPPCPSCNRQTVIISEDTYFFRLSKYQDALLKFYTDNPNFIVPRERLNEVISFVSLGLKDLSISRTTVTWGIPFPDDPSHTVYVWVEALCNYITAIGYAQSDKQKQFHYWWPADLHVVGKDIVRFHAVYWPAMLMAAGLQIPKQLLVHGWIRVDKQKMSKSLGNIVDPMVLHEKYGAEQIRYYLLRQIPINQDGNFSIYDVEQRIEADLANDLGNLLNRMVLLAQKYDVHEIQPPTIWSEQGLNLRDACLDMIEDFNGHMTDYMFHLALARLWRFIKCVNVYFHEQEPWQLAKNNKEAFMEVLSGTCHSLQVIGVFLWPIMPQKMEQLLESLGVTFEYENNIIENLELGTWHKRFMLKKIPALFEKPERTVKMEEKTEQVPEKKMQYVDIKDLAKIQLRVGTIETCEVIEDSEKLLKLFVDFGDHGKRQILSGIKPWYQPIDLISKQCIFVFNLKPRKIFGLQSEGMIFIAEDERGKPQIITVPTVIPNGTQLK